MKHVEELIVNKSAGVIGAIAHHIKEENMGGIFSVLRKYLYNDPAGSLLREVASNARDAHVEAGFPEKPIKVTLPTRLDCFLRIRDFGAGLSDEQIATLYSGYGDSSKRDSNLTVGKWGLGKFSPLAYTDSFVVNSYQKGVLNVWNSFIDPTNRGMLVKLASYPTEEPDGLEVTVPVKEWDINLFFEKAMYLFRFWEVMPEIHGTNSYQLGHLKEAREKKYSLVGDNYKFTRETNPSVVVMGGVPYPIDPKVFVNEIPPEAKSVLAMGIILYVGIGDLGVSASREGLEYSATTKQAFSKLMEGVVADLTQKVTRPFSECKTLWDAKVLYGQWASQFTESKLLGGFLMGKISFNGRIINSNLFGVGNSSIEVFRRKEKNGKCRVRCVDVDVKNFAPGSRVAVVENNLPGKTQVGRVTQLIEGPRKLEVVYSISFPTPEHKAQFLKQSGFDGEMIPLSSLAKEPIHKYYGRPSRIQGTANSKYTCKDFEFDKGYKSCGSGDKLAFFNESEVDVNEDEGVYVIIDKFEYFERNSARNEPQVLAEFCQNMQNFGLNMPTIYAFKQAREEQVRANENMVSLWNWLDKAVPEFIEANPEKKEKIAEFLAYRRMKLDGFDTGAAGGFFSQSKIDGSVDVMSLLAGVTENKSLEPVTSFVGALQYRNVKVNWDSLKPSIDTEDNFKAMKAKYPMLFLALRKYECFLPAQVQIMDDYIRFVLQHP